jgi:hypothetical protein
MAFADGTEYSAGDLPLEVVSVQEAGGAPVGPALVVGCLMMHRHGLPSSQAIGNGLGIGYVCCVLLERSPTRCDVDGGTVSRWRPTRIALFVGISC